MLGDNIVEVDFWRDRKDSETTSKGLMIRLVLWVSTNLSLRGIKKFNVGVLYCVPHTKELAFDTGVSEFLADFGNVFHKFLESMIGIFMLGLFNDLLSIGINYKVQNIDPRCHMMFSDFYSDFIDFHGSFSKRNSY